MKKKSFRPLPGFYSYKRKGDEAMVKAIETFPSPSGVLFLQTEQKRS